MSKQQKAAINAGSEEAAMPTPSPCPECGADWRSTELTGEARRGAGYRVLCHVCGHKWDDPNASYIQREEARRG